MQNWISSGLVLHWKNAPFSKSPSFVLFGCGATSYEETIGAFLEYKYSPEKPRCCSAKFSIPSLFIQMLQLETFKNFHVWVSNSNTPFTAAFSSETQSWALLTRDNDPKSMDKSFRNILTVLIGCFALINIFSILTVPLKVILDNSSPSQSLIHSFGWEEWFERRIDRFGLRIVWIEFGDCSFRQEQCALSIESKRSTEQIEQFSVWLEHSHITTNFHPFTFPCKSVACRGCCQIAC